MSVAKKSLVFSAGTLLSRLTGVLRESVIGWVFGASVYVDAYNIAYRIPNLLRELLAEGALGSSFTKVYTEIKSSKEGDGRAEALLRQTLFLLFMLTMVLSILGVVFASQLVNLMSSPRINGESSDVLLQSSVGLTQVLFPFIIFAAMGAVIQGVLYQVGKFFVAATSSIAFNIASIFGSLVLAPLFVKLLPLEVASYFGNAEILGLTVGTLLGGFLQAFVQFLSIRKTVFSKPLFVFPALKLSDDVKRVMTLMVPMILAGASGQVNVVVNTNFATSLQAGAVTWLSFAFRLLQLPIGLFGVAISAVILPSLTRSITLAGGKVNQEASREIVSGLDLVVWLMAPCTVILMIAAKPITEILFEAGRFTAADTTATAEAMTAYSVGLCGYGVIKVMNSYYYAVGRTKFPMYVGLFSIIVNYGLNSMLVHDFGHKGLALTASAVLSMNATMLLLGMSKDRVEVDWTSVLRSIGLLAAASCTAYVLATIAMPVLAEQLRFLSGEGASHLLAKKALSFVQVCMSLVIIAVPFVAAASVRYKMTPMQVLKALRRRKR